MALDARVFTSDKFSFAAHILEVIDLYSQLLLPETQLLLSIVTY